jgi:hypothetical protein
MASGNSHHIKLACFWKLLGLLQSGWWEHMGIIEKHENQQFSAAVKSPKRPTIFDFCLAEGSHCPQTTGNFQRLSVSSIEKYFFVDLFLGSLCQVKTLFVVIRV